MAAPTPRNFLFPLHASFENGSLVVGVARSHYVKRGLILAFALPPLLFLLVLIFCGALLGEEIGDVALVIAATLGLIAGIAGMILVALSGSLARRSRVVFDRGRGIVIRERDGASAPLDAIRAVRVRKSDGPLGGGFFILELARGDGAPLLALNERVQASHGRDLDAFTRFVAETLQVFADVPTTLATESWSGPGQNIAAALCYIPVQGIFIGASLYYLITARDRPFVRFAAIQSLLHTTFAIAVLVVLMLVLGVPTALVDDGPLRVGLAIGLGLGLTLFWIGNLTIHIYATIQAWRGRAWVMPWLRFATRRWVPANLRAD
jgi:uncharacterized membrane protein